MASKALGTGASPAALAIVVGVAGCLASNVMPLLVAVSSRVFDLSAASAGRATAAEMFGFAAGSAAISLLLSRTTVARLMTASLLLIIVGNVLTVGFGAKALLTLRFVTGVGEGAATAAMAAAFAGTAAPGRYFGIFLFSTMVIATVMFRFDAAITAAAGPYAVYWILAAVAVVAVPAGLLVRRPAPMPAARAAHGEAPFAASPTALIAISLIGMIIYLAAWTTTWAYAENVCQWSGLSSQGCDVVLGYALIAGMVGSGLAAVLGPRFGNVIPLLAGATLMAAAAVLMIVDLTPRTFPIAILPWLGCMQLITPYLVAVMSEADREGRAASLTIAAETLGMSIGPALGALVVERHNPSLLAGLSLILLVPSMGAILAVARRIGKSGPALGVTDFAR